MKLIKYHVFTDTGEKLPETICYTLPKGVYYLKVKENKDFLFVLTVPEDRALTSRDIANMEYGLNYERIEKYHFLKTIETF